VAAEQRDVGKTRIERRHPGAIAEQIYFDRKLGMRRLKTFCPAARERRHESVAPKPRSGGAIRRRVKRREGAGILGAQRRRSAHERDEGEDAGENSHRSFFNSAATAPASSGRKPPSLTMSCWPSWLRR